MRAEWMFYYPIWITKLHWCHGSIFSIHVSGMVQIRLSSAQKWALIFLYGPAFCFALALNVFSESKYATRNSSMVTHGILHVGAFGLLDVVLEAIYKTRHHWFDKLKQTDIFFPKDEKEERHKTNRVNQKKWPLKSKSEKPFITSCLTSCSRIEWAMIN